MISKLRDRGTSLVDEERGVSPVIGVALLIAITVVLAAVIGFVVLDAGTGPSDTPSARLALSGDTSADTLTLKHEGGDPLRVANLEVKSSDGSNEELSGVISTTSSIETGDSFDIGTVSGGTFSSGETITIIYDPPNQDGKTQLASFTFP